MLDNESIRCFLAAMRHLNFRAAAAEVYLSPAAFSDRIQRLEQDLGSRLFQRSTRMIQPTAAAYALLVEAENLLHAEQRCRSVVRQDPLPVEFTIGTRYELGLSFVVPILKKLRASHPHWTVHVFFGDTPSLLSAFRQGKIDIVFGSMRLDLPKLHIRQTHLEEYSFVGTPELLQEKPIRSIADLTRHTLVDIGADLPLFRYFLDCNTLTEQPTFTDRIYAGTIAAILSFIEEGYGIGVLPTYFIRPKLQDRSCHLVLPQHRPQHDHFRLFWKARHWAEEAFEELALLIKNHPLK